MNKITYTPEDDEHPVTHPFKYWQTRRILGPS